MKNEQFDEDQEHASPTEFLNDERNESEEDEAKEERKNTDKDKKILERYQKRRKAMEAKWTPIHAEAKQDWNIYTLKQWTDNAIRARQNRIRLTSDTGRKFVKAVVADLYTTPPAVKLTARDQGASFKANAMGDAIRFFEDHSGAKYAYTWAAECAAVAGFGWLRTDYRYDPQMDMPAILSVNKVLDPFSVIIDDDSVELDGKDMRDACELQGKTSRSKTGKIHNDKVTYWYTDPDTEAKEDDKMLVKWAVIEGDSVESKGIWPGSMIPIIPVYGEIYSLQGEFTIFGIIRQLRDNIRSYNYMLSEAVERVALTGKTTVMADERAIPEEYRNDWSKRATDPVSILFRKGMDQNGPIDKPEVISTTPDVGWVTPMLQQILQNEKESVGIYDTSLGASDQQGESGRAIVAKQKSSDRGQLVYSEHVQLSIRRQGEIFLDLMQPVLEPGGILPTLTEDGKTGMLPIQPAPIDQVSGLPVQTQAGQEPGYIEDLNPGDLDISVSSAPSYSTRKEEGLDRIQSLFDGTPELKSQTIDLVIRQMDFPGSKEIADRLYRALPPNLQDNPQGQADPAVLQQQVQQMQQQLLEAQQAATQLQQQNQMLQLEIQNNAQATLAGKQIDAQSRIAVAQINANVGNVRVTEKIASDERMALAKIDADAQQHDADVEYELAKARAEAAGMTVVAHPKALVRSYPAPTGMPVPQAIPPFMPGGQI